MKYANHRLLILAEWLPLLKLLKTEQHIILELLHARCKSCSAIFGPSITATPGTTVGHTLKGGTVLPCGNLTVLHDTPASLPHNSPNPRYHIFGRASPRRVPL